MLHRHSAGNGNIKDPSHFAAPADLCSDTDIHFVQTIVIHIILTITITSTLLADLFPVVLVAHAWRFATGSILA